MSTGKVKFEVDFSGFWADDESLTDAMQRIVRDECESEVRKHIKSLLTERRSETAKEVASALKNELAKIANRLSQGA